MDELISAQRLFKVILMTLAGVLIGACGHTPPQPDQASAAQPSDKYNYLNNNHFYNSPPPLPENPDQYLVTTTANLWERLGEGFGLEKIPASMSPESEPEPQDLWTRIRAGFALPNRRHPKAYKEAQEYADSRDYLDATIERAKPYLYYVVEEIEKRGMPTEIALIPVIESAYQASANSSSGAAGIWQLIPSTGRHFGLKKDFWYDGRRDIAASTQAALKYLEKLNTDFDGDWLLTLAAYNAGEGTVLRAVKKNRQAGKPIDFWSLDLPRETEAYVPRLLGIAALVDAPEDFGVTLASIPNEPYLTSVELDGQINLKLAAKMAGMSDREIRHLNPGFTNGVTDPRGEHPLLLPADKAARFTAKLATLDPAKRLGDTPPSKKKAAKKKPDAKRLEAHAAPAGKQPITYTVRAGDSLARIAQRFKITVAQLQEWNTDLTGKYLQPGHNLKLYIDGAVQAVP